jgi:hypothetical protein
MIWKGASVKISVGTAQLVVGAVHGNLFTRSNSFCEDDCEISSTFARISAVVENVRPTTSGNPTIPGPPTLISVTSRIAVSAFTPPPMMRPSVVFPGRNLLFLLPRFFSALSLPCEPSSRALLDAAVVLPSNLPFFRFFAVTGFFVNRSSSLSSGV